MLFKTAKALVAEFCLVSVHGGEAIDLQFSSEALPVLKCLETQSQIVRLSLLIKLIICKSHDAKGTGR